MNGRRWGLFAVALAVLCAGSFVAADPLPLRFVSPLVKTGTEVGCPTCSTGGVPDPIVPVDGTQNITGNLRTSGTVQADSDIFIGTGHVIKAISGDTYVDAPASQIIHVRPDNGNTDYTFSKTLASFPRPLAVTGSAGATNFSGPLTRVAVNRGGSSIAAGDLVDWMTTGSPASGSVQKAGSLSPQLAGVAFQSIANGAQGTIVISGSTSCTDGSGGIVAGDLLTYGGVAGRCVTATAGQKTVGVALTDSVGIGSPMPLIVRPTPAYTVATGPTEPPAAGLAWRLDPKQITGVVDGTNLNINLWTVQGAGPVSYDGTVGPKYHSSGAGTINGHASVTYQSTSGYVLANAQGAQPVITVGSGTDILVSWEMVSTGTATNTLFQSGFAGTYFSITRVGTNIVATADGGLVTITKAIPDLLQHNWTFARHQTISGVYQYTLYLDGAASGTASGGVTGTGNFASVYIGYGNTDEMPEWLVYTTADAQTVADIESYAHAYWGNP